MRGARLAGQPLAVDDFQDVGCVDLAVDLGQGPAELDAAGEIGGHGSASFTNGNTLAAGGLLQLAQVTVVDPVGGLFAEEVPVFKLIKVYFL